MNIRMTAAAGFSAVVLAAAGAEPVAAGTHYAEEYVTPALTNGFVGGISVFTRADKCEVALIGWADREARRPMTMDTMFRICSQTKGVCGVAALTFVERGELDLDDPVARYLPEFERLWIESCSTGGVRVLTQATTPLTVRHCLTHTGGFPFSTRLNSVHGWTSVPLALEATAAAAEPLLGEPGVTFRYSNTGIDIAAAVLEKIAGKDFETICRERIFEPLGMTDATFYPSDEQLARAAKCYAAKTGDGEPVAHEPYTPMPDPADRRHRFASAGAGLWCTTADLVRFYRMIANRGVGDNGVRVLSERSVTEYLARSLTPPGEQEYSLGINIERKYPGWIGHGGALNTNCILNPADGSVRLWMVQYSGSDEGLAQAYAAWERAGDAFFGERGAEGAVSTEFVGRTHE